MQASVKHCLPNWMIPQSLNAQCLQEFASDANPRSAVRRMQCVCQALANTWFIDVSASQSTSVSRLFAGIRGLANGNGAPISGHESGNSFSRLHQLTPSWLKLYLPLQFSWDVAPDLHSLTPICLIKTSIKILSCRQCVSSRCWPQSKPQAAGILVFLQSLCCLNKSLVFLSERLFCFEWRRSRPSSAHSAIAPLTWVLEQCVSNGNQLLDAKCRAHSLGDSSLTQSVFCSAGCGRCPVRAAAG